MKKIILTTFLTAGFSGSVLAQSALDAYSLAQPDMKGTARYMSMAGAFGALGGDLTAMTKNPAGIGVYRNGDIGFTLNLDCQSTSSNSQGFKYDMSQTKFLLNNIGAVVSMRLPSTTVPNINFGFAYNKGVSFNRRYGGEIPKLNGSMTNYIAGLANSEYVTEGELASTSSYDPYNPPSGDYAPPWLAILGYNGYLMTPSYNQLDGNTTWYGQWENGITSGKGAFLMNERGSVDEYNIVIGGNIKNVVYWGMNFDITNLNYSINSVWSENLDNAFVPDDDNNVFKETSDWSLNNIYSVSGTGFNYQLGLIVKPIQELRLGFAFHTPTWYNLTENFGATVNYAYGNTDYGSTTTNGGVLGYNDMSFRTPWKIMASAAGVIGSNFIISFDYEWEAYNTMKFGLPNNNGFSFGYDDYYPWDYMSSGYGTKSGISDIVGDASNNPYYYTNQDISEYYKSTNTFRVGAEFRVTPAFSIRAGYANISSPVKPKTKNNQEIIYTAGTRPSFRFDNSTNYVTCGLGYKFDRFYVDLAYVYKHISSDYHAYTSDPGTNGQSPVLAPESKLSLNNNQIVLSAGFRF